MVFRVASSELTLNPLTLRFRVPTAAKPCDFTPSEDCRELGFSISLIEVAARSD